MNDHVAQPGWFETFKQKMQIDTLMDKLNLSKDKLIEMGIWLGIGFLAGFLFKKYAQYLAIVVLTLVALAVLQQFEFITVGINWAKFQGLQPVPVSEGANLLTVYWEWVKANFAVVLSFSVGFFVGLKVG